MCNGSRNSASAEGVALRQAALAEEHRRGHAREIVGLEVDWTGVERLYEAAGLPPSISPIASRVAVPVF